MIYLVTKKHGIEKHMARRYDMQRMLHILKQTKLNRKYLILAAGYMAFMIVVVMSSPTNASFTDETTIKGHMKTEVEFEEDDMTSSDENDEDESNQDTSDESEEIGRASCRERDKR